MPTPTAKTTFFSYDDLNRLLTASTTNATSGSNYFHRYNYSAIGNIASSTPAGTYSYGGSTYANPHAATSINGVTYTYDTNGNLTSDGIWSHSWDYRNRLTQSSATSTTTYGYDHTNTRVQFKTSNTTSTVIASPTYSVENGVPVKHIYAGGLLVATIRGSGGSASPYYVHTDHLGSTEKLTDASGTIQEITDYMPYGVVRQSSGSLTDRKGYIGKDYDSETGLTQAEARYYSSAVGRFISQDPAFWQLSLDSLSNPQILNSYSYSQNNPITYFDKNGEEPVKAQAGTSADFRNVLDISPNKVGGYTGSSAQNYMLLLGTTDRGTYAPSQAGYFYDQPGRYIYTEQGGWVDMEHFMFYAGRAYQYKQEGLSNPARAALNVGYLQETTDFFKKNNSSFSYEDLSSDKFGAEFGASIFSPDSQRNLGTQIKGYLDFNLGANKPQNAPNYGSIPKSESASGPSARNYSSQPMFTTPTLSAPKSKLSLPKNYLK